MTQRRLTAILVGVLLICLLAGGAGAYLIGRQNANNAAAGEPVTPTVRGSDPPAPPTHAETQQPADTATSEPIDPPTTKDSTEPPTTKDSTEPPTTAPSQAISPADESSAVVLAGVAADDAQAEEIRALLQRHFDAINNRDYQQWASTVTKEQSAALGSDRWNEEYSTTVDTEIFVIVINDDPRQAQLTFRSRQDPEKAPDKKSTCVRWEVTLPLTTVDNTLLIGVSKEHLARYRPCPGS